MSIESKPYFWIKCDREGCEATTEDMGSDFAAWSDAGQAEDEWGEYAQCIEIDGEVRHYCDEHRVPQCSECDAPGNPDHPDEFCAECAKADEVDQ